MVTSWPRATSRPSRPAPNRTRWLVVGRADEMKDLLPSDRDLHRLPQRAGGERGQDRLAVYSKLGAESPTDIRRDQVNALRVDPKRAGDRATRLAQHLRANVD